MNRLRNWLSSGIFTRVSVKDSWALNSQQTRHPLAGRIHLRRRRHPVASPHTVNTITARTADYTSGNKPERPPTCTSHAAGYPYLFRHATAPAACGRERVTPGTVCRWYLTHRQSHYHPSPHRIPPHLYQRSSHGRAHDPVLLQRSPLVLHP